MGLFRVRNGSVVATLLGIAVVLDLVELCIAMNSRFQRFNSHNPSDSLMERKITIKMPGTHPQKTDTYLCTGVQLLPHKEYIVQFEPSASADRAHHMLLFGCIMPGAGSPSWDCNSGQYGACMGSEEILYAWAKNAPPKYLPEGVGFAIGGDSAIKYLVLQVHYANVNSLQDGEKDYSGFILHTRRKSLPYLGGIFLMWAYQGVIPPETSGVHVDVACQYKQSETMNAFAFRTHAHKLAKVITGYRIRNGIWTLLGKGDPQAPQAFYPMKTMIDIRTGDILAARCTYDSRGHYVHKVVHMGSSGHDEMCNFYIMYYSTAGRLEYSGGDCGEQNHPEIFKDFPADSDTPLSPIASTLPAHSVMSSDGMEAATTTEEYKEAANNPTVFPTDLASSEPEKTETKANVIGLPELRVLNNWPNLTALEKSKLGQVTGVAVDSKGQVVIFHRGGRIWEDSTFDSSNVFRDADMVGTISEHTVWILDSATGKVRGFWGKDLFYLPHGLTIDHRDNLWVTDVGSHQVFKFSPLSDRTQRLLSLGHKLVPGADNSRFCKPTSVAVDKTGEFYVADGYCNSRIMKFSSTGKLMNIWGKPSYFGHGMPSLGSFMVPHSLALDRTQQRLFIADRENGRVQVMNSKSGAFIDEIKFPEFGGLVYAVDYSYGEQGGVLRIVNGPTTDKKRKVPVQGFTIRVADKALIQTWPSENRQSFLEPHDLTSSADGTEVYVVEIGPNRIWKLASTIPTITTELLDVLESKSQTLNTEESKNHSTNRVELVEEKAKLIPTHLGITKPGDGDKSLQQTVDNEKPESTTLDAVKSSASQKGGSGKEASVNSGNQNSTDEVKTVVYSTTGTPIGHPLDHQDSKSEKDNPTTDRDNTNSESHTLQAGTVRLRITEAAKPEPTPSGSSESTPKNDALDGDESQDSENITKGVIPALVILSILAVPIVFLLLISVVLRVRAFQRDRNRPTKGFHDSKNELTVGRTRGWWSYMNCFDKQRYRFNRVTLSDFYSDSDSDEV